MTITQEQFKQLDESFVKDPSAGTKSEELYLLKLAHQILSKTPQFCKRPSIFHSYATAHVKSNPDAHLLIRCLDIINNPPVSSRDCSPTTPISDTREFKLSVLEYDIKDYLATQKRW